MGVDHGGGYILVPKELLDGADVVSTAQKVSGKRMAQGMRGGCFLDPGLSESLFDGTLEKGLSKMVPAHGLAAWINGKCAGREDVLPHPLAGSIRIFAGQGKGQPDITVATGEIPFVQKADLAQMGF